VPHGRRASALAAFRTTQPLDDGRKLTVPTGECRQRVGAGLAGVAFAIKPDDVLAAAVAEFLNGERRAGRHHAAIVAKCALPGPSSPDAWRLLDVARRYGLTFAASIIVLVSFTPGGTRCMPIC